MTVTGDSGTNSPTGVKQVPLCKTRFKMQLYRKIFLVSFYALSFLYFISCTANEKGKLENEIATAETSTSEQNNVKSLTDTNSIFVTSGDLVTEYLENEVKADREFKGRKLIVKGEIIDIKRGVSGQTFIVLQGGQGSRHVQCYYSNEEDIEELKRGQNVYMQGICDGLWVNVLMSNCIRVGEFIN